MINFIGWWIEMNSMHTFFFSLLSFRYKSLIKITNMVHCFRQSVDNLVDAVAMSTVIAVRIRMTMTLIRTFFVTICRFQLMIMSQSRTNEILNLSLAKFRTFDTSFNFWAEQRILQNVSFNSFNNSAPFPHYRPSHSNASTIGKLNTRRFWIVVIKQIYSNNLCLTLKTIHFDQQ